MFNGKRQLDCQKFFRSISNSKPFYQCRLCFEKFRKDSKNYIIKRECRDRHFFSSCSHLGSCISCAEQKMIQSIQKNEYPTCIIDKNCKAQMITNENSLFQYFSCKGKDIWKQFIRNPERKKQLSTLPKCKELRCPGLIQKNRCLKCSIYYCQICGQFDHIPTQCKKKIKKIDCNCCF